MDLHRLSVRVGSASIYFLFTLQYHSVASNHDQISIVLDTVQPLTRANRLVQSAYGLVPPLRKARALKLSQTANTPRV